MNLYGQNLTKFVDLNAWMRWLMFSLFLSNGEQAKITRKRLGWRKEKFDRVMLATDYVLTLRDVSDFFFVVEGVKLDFKLVPMESK
ncbi:hypothetical protein [Rhizobium leguminosarum]